MEDAAFIVQLRNQDHAKGKLGDSAATVSAQEQWLANYFEREGDYYFIAETQHDQTRTEKDGRIIGGQPVDMLHFSLKAADWPIARAAMLPLAKYAEDEMLRWENHNRQDAAYSLKR